VAGLPKRFSEAVAGLPKRFSEAVAGLLRIYARVLVLVVVITR
jgi:hypothetical protein